MKSEIKLLISMANGEKIVVEDTSDGRVNRIFNHYVNSNSNETAYVIIRDEKEDILINPAHIVSIKKTKA